MNYKVVSNDLPTQALLVSMSRAYAFKQKLHKLGYQASVIEIERRG